MRKKSVRAILYPHIAVVVLLVPVSAALLVYTMRTLPETSILRIGSYLLAFYTLCVLCIRAPRLVRGVMRRYRENVYAQRWRSDVHLRVKFSLGANFAFNSAYALFQLALGFYHRSAWYYALALYYFSLALMRALLMRHTLRHKPGENVISEFRRYRICGIVFLLTNTALSAMIFFLVFGNRMVRHHEITTIAMAAYTFTTLSVAIVNVVRYRRYHSPVISAAKAISLATASVSMLTLEGTMMETFRAETMTQATQQLFMALSGAAVSVLIIAMAVYMIVSPKQKIISLENQNGK